MCGDGECVCLAEGGSRIKRKVNDKEYVQSACVAKAKIILNNIWNIDNFMLFDGCRFFQ